jgi:antitoxin component YwqK of YwqJK toxin-antitoxin module
MKKSNFRYLIVFAFFLSGCAAGLEESVKESYEDGSPKVVQYFDNHGNDHRVVEEAYYYPDGQLRMRGTYLDGEKHGTWTSWYNNGNKWSEGQYTKGRNDGITSTWHENGQKYYEGHFTEGARSGVWRFWDEQGELIKEIDYSKE